MFSAYLAVTILAAAANIWAASNDFRRLDWIVANVDRLGVSPSWLPTLGILKVLGGVGLLVGLAAPSIGITAAAGLILFFIGAFVFALRVRWYGHLLYPAVWLALAAASLALRIGTAPLR
ncbi:MAG: DoxX family protein [Acidobacteriaceae bacterium]